MSQGGTTLASPYFADAKSYGVKEHITSDDTPDNAQESTSGKSARRCGMKRRTCMILFGCVAVWIIAIALGLGLGLKYGLKKKSSYVARAMLSCSGTIPLTSAQRSEHRSDMSRKPEIVYRRCTERGLSIKTRGVQRHRYRIDGRIME